MKQHAVDADEEGRRGASGACDIQGLRSTRELFFPMEINSFDFRLPVLGNFEAAGTWFFFLQIFELVHK